METKEELIETIGCLIETHQKMRGSIKLVITSKDRSLNDRWDIFLKAVPYLEVDIYGNGCIDVLGLESVYDEFYMERHQTKMYDDLDELIRDYTQEADDPKWIKAAQLYDDWREAVLKDGYGGFTYDW